MSGASLAPAAALTPVTELDEVRAERRAAFTYYDRAAAIAALTTVEVGGKAVKVTRTAKLVAFQLAHHWNQRTGQCNPYQETLAAEIGESVAVVQKAVALLKRIGALEVAHGRGNRASYALREVENGGSRTATRARNQNRHQAADPSTNYETELRRERPVVQPEREKVGSCNTAPAANRPTTTPSREKPASEKQLALIASLAAERAVEVPAVTTRTEADQEIKRLLALKKSQAAEDWMDRRVASTSTRRPTDRVVCLDPADYDRSCDFMDSWCQIKGWDYPISAEQGHLIERYWDQGEEVSLIAGETALEEVA